MLFSLNCFYYDKKVFINMLELEFIYRIKVLYEEIGYMNFCFFIKKMEIKLV